MKPEITTAIKNAASYFELYPEETGSDNQISIPVNHYSECPSYGISHIDTAVFTKRGYKKFEELCNAVRKYQGFTLCFSYDVSGYSYWTKDMEESNYVSAEIIITSEPEVNPEHLERALIDFITVFMRGYENIFNNKNNMRKAYQED